MQQINPNVIRKNVQISWLQLIHSSIGNANKYDEKKNHSIGNKTDHFVRV
jgi:hypothetical protein